MDTRVTWLLESDEPWTRYRTLLDLQKLTSDDARVCETRTAMLAHPLVNDLIDTAVQFPTTVLKRHNDAQHPLYALSTLADFGLVVEDDSRLSDVIHDILDSRNEHGLPLTRLGSAHFSNKEESFLTWMLCDVPTLLYVIQRMQPAVDVASALSYIAELASENGWHCIVSPELGAFRGPGRKDDPCPIANVYALKALSLSESYAASDAVHAGTEMLLTHWERQREVKHYLFGVGTQFRRLKYPFIWYDILHVCDVLSRFPWVHEDPRYQDMVIEIVSQADDAGRFTAGSMYRAWKDWSFADKKEPSPWLTLLVNRILIRSGKPIDPA